MKVAEGGYGRFSRSPNAMEGRERTLEEVPRIRRKLGPDLCCNKLYEEE
jgi:hypothetical protein